jgi:hypothetical protein
MRLHLDIEFVHRNDGHMEHRLGNRMPLKRTSSPHSGTDMEVDGKYTAGGERDTNTTLGG